MKNWFPRLNCLVQTHGNGSLLFVFFFFPFLLGHCTVLLESLWLICPTSWLLQIMTIVNAFGVNWWEDLIELYKKKKKIVCCVRENVLRIIKAWFVWFGFCLVWGIFRSPFAPVLLDVGIKAGVSSNKFVSYFSCLGLIFMSWVSVYTMLTILFKMLLCLATFVI